MSENATIMTDDQLAKALDAVAERMARPEQAAGNDDAIDATAFLQSLDGNLSDLAKDVRSFGGGVQAVAELAKALKVENASLKSDLGGLRETVDAMAKAMRLPQAGRAVTTAAPVPHPNGEQPGEGAASVATKTIGEVIDLVKSKYVAETDPSKKAQLADMLGRVKYRAVSPDEFKAHGINV